MSDHDTEDALDPAEWLDGKYGLYRVSPDKKLVMGIYANAQRFTMDQIARESDGFETAFVTRVGTAIAAVFSFEKLTDSVIATASQMLREIPRNDVG